MNLKKMEKKVKEICLVVTTDKNGVVEDAMPYTTLLTAVNKTKLSYNVVARNIRENGFYLDDSNINKNVWYFKKPLMKGGYNLKQKTKRIANLLKK